MKIKYMGTHTAVNVYPETGGEILCPRDRTVKVPDSLGKRLLEQKTNWKKVRK